jgi:ferredoxin-NADP reductase
VSTATLAAVVTSATALTGAVRGLRLARTDGADLPPWEAGAHIDLVLPSGLVRQYSLCGDPRDLSHYEVAVLREPVSRGGSQEVHEVLVVGTEVGIRGPRNRFPLVDAEEYLFLAGGIGITPLLPMVVEADRRGARWRLVYGGRSRASMAFLDRVEAWSSAEVWPQEEVGLLDLPGLVTAGGSEAVYCCGPAPLLDAVTARCAEVGRLADLRLERFALGADGTEPVDGGAPFEVQVGADGPVFQVGSDASILQTLLDAGVDVLFSCEEGTCGSCETTVIAGQPDHRDALLTDAEREAGSMLLCVSRSRSPRLVLELDA